jgi:hypothetical protein
MNKGKRYFRTITIIYVAAIILTVLSFSGLGFSESLFRFVTSLVAVLLAESVVYGYCVFWLRTAGSVQRTSPVFISGAFITGIYATVVFISAIVFDWLLELPPLWYAAVQLLILLIGGIILVAIGIYGWHAGTEEKQEKKSLQALRQHQSELNEVSALASSWKHPEAEQLVKAINTLRNEFKFSDPVSDSSLYATEDIMHQQISLLHDHVKLLLMAKEPHENWQAEINEMAESITTTLERRNRELAGLK